MDIDENKAMEPRSRVSYQISWTSWRSL